MKRISTLLLITISLLGMFSCQKGDTYYYDYQRGEQLYDGTIYEYLSRQKGTYDSLVLVLERLPELRNLLNHPDSSLTLFAVNNRSFELALKNLNIARTQNNLGPLYLEDLNLALLDTLSFHYVFDESYPVSVFESYLDGESIFCSKYNYEMHVLYRILSASGLVGVGQQQLQFSDMNESIYVRYWNITNTSSVNFNTKNGVIHTLTPGHEFGFGKLTTFLANE